jgi:hypothetical protein
MTGRELSESYFYDCGLNVFRENFPEIMQYLCFALAGPGSECYGFDDELSKDHDFEPGFCIFYPEGLLDSRQVFALERAYAKLPSEFMGYKRQPVASYGGLSRRGVIGIEEYFDRYIPSSAFPPKSVGQWALIREESLAEALNGTVYMDNYGNFSNIRDDLAVPPQDIRFKRLSGLLFRLSQSLAYNVPRMYERGENGAVRLFLAEATEDVLSCLYILKERYRPYKKWLFRGMESLLSSEAASGAQSDVAKEIFEKTLKMVDAEECAVGVELAGEIANELAEAVKGACGLDSSGDNALQKCAFELNDRVADNVLRNSDIMLLV